MPSSASLHPSSSTTPPLGDPLTRLGRPQQSALPAITVRYFNPRHLKEKRRRDDARDEDGSKREREGEDIVGISEKLIRNWTAGREVKAARIIDETVVDRLIVSSTSAIKSTQLPPTLSPDLIKAYWLKNPLNQAIESSLPDSTVSLLSTLDEFLCGSTEMKEDGGGRYEQFEGWTRVLRKAEEKAKGKKEGDEVVNPNVVGKGRRQAQEDSIKGSERQRAKKDAITEKDDLPPARRERKDGVSEATNVIDVDAYDEETRSRRTNLPLKGRNQIQSAKKKESEGEEEDDDADDQDSIIVPDSCELEEIEYLDGSPSCSSKRGRKSDRTTATTKFTALSTIATGGTTSIAGPSTETGPEIPRLVVQVSEDLEVPLAPLNNNRLSGVDGPAVGALESGRVVGNDEANETARKRKVVELEEDLELGRGALQHVIPYPWKTPPQDRDRRKRLRLQHQSSIANSFLAQDQLETYLSKRRSARGFWVIPVHGELPPGLRGMVSRPIWKTVLFDGGDEGGGPERAEGKPEDIIWRPELLEQVWETLCELCRLGRMGRMDGVCVTGDDDGGGGVGWGDHIRLWCDKKVALEVRYALDFIEKPVSKKTQRDGGKAGALTVQEGERRGKHRSVRDLRKPLKGVRLMWADEVGNPIFVA